MANLNSGLGRQGAATTRVYSEKRLRGGFKPLHDGIRVAAPVSSW